jgi:exodeoxyribonuclease VII small subunit
MPPSKKRTNPTFEEALDELAFIIEQLERDDLTLDNALLHFENGIRLMRTCDSHLKNAKGKLRELVKGEDGEFITRVLGESLESFTGGEQNDG